VSLNFSVVAGATMTNVTVTSALVSFPPITVAEGRNSATMEVSDLDGNGVSASPVSGGMYSAQYNGLAPSGTSFHDLLAAAVGTAVPGGSASASEAFPGLGLYVPIVGTVNNISSRFNFVLTANDLASQTSTFRVQAVPAPGALVLLGLGGLAAARRRRH
jgi:MYXO-CTERM domain-containing protein